jgi:hypothetical protein
MKSRSRIVVAWLGTRTEWSRARFLGSAALVFLLAFSVRCLHSVDLAPRMESRAQPGVRMATRYAAAADAILRGGGILFPGAVDKEDTSLLARPPGYPLVLVLILSTLGPSTYAVQVFQNLIDGLTAVALLFFGSRLVSPRVGLVGSALWGIGHFSAYYSNLITPDTLCVLPILLALVLLLRPSSTLKYLGAGVLIGLSCWLRPNTLVLGPFAALLLPFCFGAREWIRSLVLGLACLLVVSPITLRNYREYGAFVPVSVNFGIVLWEGIADIGGERFGARGKDYEVAWAEAQEHHDPRYAEWWASPDGIARDHERVRKSLDVIRAHPLFFAKGVLRRLTQMVTYDYDEPPYVSAESAPVPDRDLPVQERVCLAWGTRLAPARVLVRAAQRCLKALLVPTALLGLWVLWSAAPRRAKLLGIVPVAVLLFQSPLHLEFRVTLPMHACLLVFSAIGFAFLGGALASLVGPRSDA